MDNLLMVQQDKDDNDDGYITINKKDIHGQHQKVIYLNGYMIAMQIGIGPVKKWK